jgi:hypothetical protein
MRVIKNNSEDKYIIYLITFFSWIFILYNLQTGFKSYSDEAFFVLGLNPEQNLGIQHSQFFQIARFIFHLFRIDYAIINSRIAAFIFIFFSLLFFALASYRWLEKKGRIKKSFYLYLSLVFLWGTSIFLSGYETSFSFNHLLVFFGTFMLSFYLLWDVTNRTTIKQLFVYAIGCFSFPAIMNYFPSGILVSSALLFLILLKEKNRWKHIILSLSIFTFGFVSFAIAYNSFVYPIENAFNDIITTIKTPAFGVGGYDIYSYLYRNVDYVKNFGTICLSSIGICFIYYLNQRQKYYNKKIVSICIFIAILVFTAFEPRLFRYNILFIPVIMAGVFYYLSFPFSENRKNKIPFYSIVQGLFLFFFPFIALQGTNANIIYKLSYLSFVLIMIQAYYLFQIKDAFLYKFILYLTVIMMLGISLISHFFVIDSLRGSAFDSKYEVENHSLFNHIKLKESQINYFQEVDSILKIHDFNPKKDRIFALDYDYATLLYLNATNYGGLMHHVQNMINYKSFFFSQENAPDYIIFRLSDGRLFYKIAQNFNWQLEEYIMYEIGNPEQPRMKENRISFIIGNFERPHVRENRILLIKNNKQSE